MKRYVNPWHHVSVKYLLLSYFYDFPFYLILLFFKGYKYYFCHKLFIYDLISSHFTIDAPKKDPVFQKCILEAFCGKILYFKIIEEK